MQFGVKKCSQKLTKSLMGNTLRHISHFTSYLIINTYPTALLLWQTLWTLVFQTSGEAPLLHSPHQ